MDNFFGDSMVNKETAQGNLRWMLSPKPQTHCEALFWNNFTINLSVASVSEKLLLQGLQQAVAKDFL